MPSPTELPLYVYAVIGRGANDQETPALIFARRKDAVEFLNNVPQLERAGRYWHVPDDYELNEKICRKFYKRYYGGCGEIGSFEIRRVTLGKPFAVHNLD